MLANSIPPNNLAAGIGTRLIHKRQNAVLFSNGVSSIVDAPSFLDIAQMWAHVNQVVLGIGRVRPTASLVAATTMEFQLSRVQIYRLLQERAGSAMYIIDTRHVAEASAVLERKEPSRSQ